MPNPTTLHRLRCEYSANPIGIDAPAPRLSWQLETDRVGARQTHYRVLVGTQPGLGDYLDTGKVASENSACIRYEGKPVPSSTRVFWSVEVWDETGESVKSQEAFWETGLLNRQDWKAKWIQSDLMGGPRTTSPSPCLRHEFQVEKPIARARLYATALGLYEAHLNGERVGQIQLAPGWTDYRKRIRYQTYDVSSQLRQGSNCLGAILGDGWFCGHVEWRDRQMYGDRPKFFAQLLIEYSDGTSEVVATDGNWTFAFGEILEADIIMGEAHDLRRRLPEWSKPNAAQGTWKPVEVAAFETELVGQDNPAIEAVEEIRPVSFTEKPQWPSSWIVDMGQNMVGWVRIRAEIPAGKTITVRFAERLDEKGNFYTANYRGARSTDHFTAYGAGEEVFEPKFTFHGFQFVEISGLLKPPTIDSVTGVVLHSAWEPNGTFECSDPLINQLVSNIKWGWKGNSVDVPTDCPQRDERVGWTGDAQVFINTACRLGEVETFFEKYQQDLADSQSKQGQIPPFAPNPEVMEGDGGPAWSDAFIICPWNLYRHYGDDTILRRHYDAIVRWVDSLDISSRDLIRSYPGYTGFSGFGDWLNTQAETPIDLIGTAFYAHAADLLHRIAKLLGKADDAKKYGVLHDQIKKAFQDRFVTSAGLVASGSQTSYVLALHFNLIPDHLKAGAVQNLVEDLGRRGWHLSTGFVGTSYLPDVLTREGRIDAAYKLLHQKTWPSYLYAVTQGATTIWERWDGWTHDKGFQDFAMNSFNHYAYGAIGDWLFSTVAGIDLDPEESGYQKFQIKPRPGGELTHAKARMRSPFGWIESGWKLDEGILTMSFTIPPNSSARVTLPPEAQWLEGDVSLESGSAWVPAGSYQLRARWTPSPT